MRLVDANAGPVAGWFAPTQESFETLYRRFHPRLVAFLRRRTGDPALAEDIAQETLLRAYVNYERLDTGRPLWPWLKTIATRLVIDHARCNGREVLSEPDPDDCSMELDLFDEGLIQQAMKKLTGSQKVAVSLKYVDDWKSAEAANFLGINRDAFDQLLLRARRRLRAEYTRLSEKAMAVLLVPYKHLRRWATRVNSQFSESGASVGTFGTVGINAATQLTSSVLVLITAAGGIAAPLPKAESVSAVAKTPSIAAVEGSQPLREGAGGSDDGGAGTGGATSSAPAAIGEKPGTPEVVDKLTDPNKDVRQPEDTTITSIAFGAGSGSDQTIFAIGHSMCGMQCERVLFRSTDGGGTWKRLPATGLRGETLVVPPGGDGQVFFAMSNAGLQVTRDGGRTFEFVLTAGSPLTAGSAAVSPAFFINDPTILVGSSQTMMRYRDDTGTVQPYPSTMLGGPFAPVFSPSYTDDRRIFVGATRVRAQTNQVQAVVYTCRLSVCSEAALEGEHFSPRVKTGDRFGEKEVVLALGRSRLFVSRDGARSFDDVNVPTGGVFLMDAALSHDNQVLFASTDRKGESALLVSRDQGASWQAAASPLFENGAGTIAASSQRVLVALLGKGLACSVDGGTRWSRRCTAS